MGLSILWLPDANILKSYFVRFSLEIKVSTLKNVIYSIYDSSCMWLEFEERTWTVHTSHSFNTQIKWMKIEGHDWYQAREASKYVYCNLDFTCGKFVCEILFSHINFFISHVKFTISHVKWTYQMWNFCKGSSSASGSSSGSE